MSILIDETKRVLVQGITGREGALRTRLMREYGTNVVAGVTPGKGGQEVEGMAVFDTVEEAWEEVGTLDISVLFIPAPLVKDAALEAIEAGVKLLVIVADRVPIYDVLLIVKVAREYDAKFIGPNTLGVLSPGKAVVGMMGGRASTARQLFSPGPVGICSRSGGMTSAIAYHLSRAGIGATTAVHVGGDPIVGMSLPEVVRLFQDDPDTRAVVLFGEIGTGQEEQVADLIERGEFTKPLVALISGKAAREGVRFSHAGAIIEGGHGTYENKVRRLREAGAVVVEAFEQIPQAVKKALTKGG